jgi:hypothetical protein
MEKPFAQPDSTSFFESLSIILGSTEEAEIYYTLNNDEEPNSSSQRFVASNPIILQDTATIKAIAIKDGISSEIATFTYTKLNQPLPTVTAVTNQEHYANSSATRTVNITFSGKVTTSTFPVNNITLQILNSSAQPVSNPDDPALRNIALSQDGSFTGNWTLPVDLPEGTYSLQAIYFGHIFTNLDTFSVTHIEKPFAEPAPTEFTNSQSVTLSCPTQGASIYYTLDNQEPSSNSLQYVSTKPINLLNTTTIKTVAIKDGVSSEVVSFTYTRLGQPVDECFIATASYGSKFEPSVVLLRQFRDSYLLTNIPGRAFVAFYYQNSPPIAAYIARVEPLKIAVRGLLIPVVAFVYLLFHPLLMCVLLALLIIFILVRFRKRLQVSKA